MESGDIGEDAYKIMSRFPSLSCSDNFGRWSGFLSTALGKTIRLVVSVPNFPHTTNMSLETEKLDAKTVDYWETLLEQIPREKSGTLFELLKELEALVAKQGGGSASLPTGSLGKLDMCAKVSEEIERIGIKKVSSLSRDITKLIFKHEDDFGRRHYLKLCIPPGYPHEPPSVEAAFPVPDDSIDWPKNIVDIHKVFEDYLGKFQEFWNEMDYMDGQARVMDPVPPMLSHYHRKMLLDNGVLVHLEFNSLAPREVPHVSFTGPEKLAAKLTEEMDKSFTKWDKRYTVLRNLETILDCTFVPKDVGGSEGDAREPCMVCLVYKFEDEIPSCICDCGACFHLKCLNDLYENDPTDVMQCSVSCPSCNMHMRVSRNN